MQHLYSCTPDKFEVLDEFLKSCDRKKVLIYRKFIDSDEQLKKRYPDIKILSIQSHAYGLNLQDYNVIIGWDKVWDYALENQRDARIIRTGQQDDCRIVSMTGRCNLEDLMKTNVAKKGALLKYFKEHGFTQLIEKL
jgi:SNF2 family DNA or RNA helicase